MLRAGLTRTGNFGASTEKSGWHLLGNPYPAPLDWDVAPVPAGLSGAISVCRSTSPTQAVYLTRANGLGSLPDGLIAIGQAFFVRVIGDDPVDFPFTNALRTTTFDNVPVYRAAPAPRPVLRLTLAQPTAPALLADEVTVYAEPGATPGLDARYDGPRPGRNVGAPTLAALTPDGQELAVSGLAPADLLGAGTTVPLLLDVPAAGTWALHVADLRHLSGTAVTLTDALTGTRYDLHQQAEITFTAAQPGEIRDRFTLHFTPQPLTDSPLPPSHLSTLPPFVLSPNPATGRTHLTGAAPGTAIEVRDVAGRLVRTATAADSPTALDLTGLAPGVYVVRAGSATRRLVVE